MYSHPSFVHIIAGYTLHSSIWLFANQMAESDQSGCPQEIDIVEQYARAPGAVSAAVGNLHPFNEKDLTAVVVTQGPQSVTLTQQTGEEDTETFWAQQDTPDLEHPTAGAWLSKVLRMRAKNQVAAADVPEGLESAFTLALSDGEANWTVDVFKVPGDDKRVFAFSIGF